MKIYNQKEITKLYQSAATFLLIAFLTAAASSSFAQTTSPVYFNEETLAAKYSSGSDGSNSNKIQNMGVKIGYISNGTYVIFDQLVIPDDKKPNKITIMYSSGGSGGKVKFIAGGMNMMRTQGITLGEFDLPSTGGWENYRNVTFQLDYDNPNFNYLNVTVPLKLEFTNPEASDYLFDIVKFKIENASLFPSTPFTFDKIIPATLFSSESDPANDDRIRNMSYKVGYIRNGTSIKFDSFNIPNTAIKGSNIPGSVTITYSSGGSGGKVKFTAEGNDSNMKPGIVIGEFDLPNTGGWDIYKTVTFSVPQNQNLNYLGYVPATPPLRLDFTNSASNDYLFDIVDFKINSAP
ncbi:carbohydrate-binding protein [Actimicrobium sp. CCI2.3]|uniref:carbohydrate-binding protein n=1 Tax=Actimicrobium sp. CCI2.3 TaxID=3048616 RepID=UPI002AB38C4D|nr:carbohydrate-binding protein [Actimicrobium sp. CCI2.3]MDY7572767.1 carbohydrate-binding protein [Actimicrobium sp. CCI2.3]MEB0022287.1 carbohydrate-binding protein [Actimicrobium sp. CCI2.3]